MEDIKKIDGTLFGNKASLVAVLKQKGFEDTHEAIEKEDGWVGVIKPATKKPNASKEKLIKCRVHRTNCDPENKDMPISVTVNTANNKRVFWPGQEVELTASQIGVLKDSVQETSLPIPPESGIYDSQNPMALAKAYFPTMTPITDPVTGTINMVSRTPNYIVESI